VREGGWKGERKAWLWRDLGCGRCRGREIRVRGELEINKMVWSRFLSRVESLAGLPL